MSEKNTSGLDDLLDCHTCAHSQFGTDRTSHFPRLVCSITLKTADFPCELFQYCPWSDQQERGAQ